MICVPCVSHVKSQTSIGSLLLTQLQQSELNRVSSEQEREKKKEKYSFYEAPVGVSFPPTPTPILLEIKIRLTDSFCQFNFFFFTLKETFGRQCAPVSHQGKESNGTSFLNFIYLFIFRSRRPSPIWVWNKAKRRKEWKSRCMST